MAVPVPSFYESNDVDVINDANPIAFGLLSKGSIAYPSDTEKRQIHLWNDKGGGAGSVEMQDVKIGVKDSNGLNTGEFIAGTVLNGYQPFFQGRSSGAQGTTDDAQSDWQVIGGDTYRDIGNIPSNGRRTIYFRCNLASDATVGSFNGLLVCDFDYED